eukprot:jgi/Chlat1/3963/Chrsp26S04039
MAAELQELESAMMSNLLLLGLEPEQVKARYGVELHERMFRVSNIKAMEIVVHFLLTKLDPEQSKKIVRQRLNELEDASALPRNTSRGSALRSCCGERFIEIMWQLSAHVLRVTSSRELPQLHPTPTTTESDLPALLRTTKEKVAKERERFLAAAATAASEQARWAELAQELTREYHSLCDEQATLERQAEELEKRKLESQTLDNVDESVADATEMWSSLLRYADVTQGAKDLLEIAVTKRRHRYAIDGATLAGTNDKPGELDITQLLRKWLQDIVRQLRATAVMARAATSSGSSTLLHQSEEHKDALQEHLDIHQHHLASLQARAIAAVVVCRHSSCRRSSWLLQTLVTKLEQTLPQLQESISTLQKEATELDQAAVTTQAEGNLADASGDCDALPLVPSAQLQSKLHWPAPCSATTPMKQAAPQPTPSQNNSTVTSELHAAAAALNLAAETLSRSGAAPARSRLTQPSQSARTHTRTLARRNLTVPHSEPHTLRHAARKENMGITTESPSRVTARCLDFSMPSKPHANGLSSHDTPKQHGPRTSQKTSRDSMPESPRWFAMFDKVNCDGFDLLADVQPSDLSF